MTAWGQSRPVGVSYLPSRSAMPYAPLAGATAPLKLLRSSTWRSSLQRTQLAVAPFNSAVISSPVNVPDFNKAAAMISI